MVLRTLEYYLPREVMEWIAENDLGPRDNAYMQGEIATFFAGDRCFGPLPKNAGSESNEKLWKARFWKHRDDAWAESWFHADKAGKEMEGLAESFARSL